MQIKDKINQTLGFVEQYYHLHKRDALKPKIWDLIIAIRYLSKEVDRLNHNRLKCFCGKDAVVLTVDKHLFCFTHAVDSVYCPECGRVLDCYYCDHCEADYILDADMQVDDYDKDYMYDER